MRSCTLVGPLSVLVHGWLPPAHIFLFDSQLTEVNRDSQADQPAYAKANRVDLVGKCEVKNPTTSHDTFACMGQTPVVVLHVLTGHFAHTAKQIDACYGAGLGNAAPHNT